MKRKVAQSIFIKVAGKGVHVVGVRRNNGAAEYCMKEDTRVEGPWEFGTRPFRRDSPTDWNVVWENAKEGAIEKIPTDVRVRYYNSIKKI